VDRGFLVDDPHDYTHQVVHENILQVTLGASRNLSIYTDSIDPASLELMLRSFEAMRAEWQIGNALCVVELPFWYPLAKELGKRYGWEVVYDCMDEHEDFATNEGQMVSKEAELAREAALVVVTSQYLERKMAPLNPRRALIRNATDFNHFARRPEEDLCSGITHPIIGYYGAISEWFDQELVAHAARKLNYCSFVLIGGNDAGGSLATLEQCPNVRLLGEQPYAQLPKYLHSFDVCIIPFQLRKLMEATNPVKFYEYISAGKPVVSVMLPELFPYRDHLYLADGKDDFVAKIEQALNERDDSIRQGRIALARDNTWEKRYQAFRDAVDALFPRVSIIVITFGNLDLTRRCIDSIFAKSQYPNFEVIIVDNASTDGTPEYLRDLAARNASVKIILNQDNKGFAAANNQGLAIAGGDIIVLLNNDTVVTPGWLSKLTRYLRDESIGMVGPATNMCGNESIIHVPYNVDTLDDLDAFAQRYHQLHPLPEAFDIDMLAMFCVAFRRKTFEQIGPLDERFGLGMFEDTDYAERLKRAGYRIVSARDVFVHHNCKASFGKLPNADYTRIYEENRRKFEEKWQRQSQY
jgi:GT2 family glycosyltransferase/glycosyltransferase involved in cell wall biosynthesis